MKKNGAGYHLRRSFNCVCLPRAIFAPATPAGLGFAVLWAA
jgi:hypothetical protein